MIIVLLNTIDSAYFLLRKIGVYTPICCIEETGALKYFVLS